MENKLISITARPVDASRTENQIVSQVSFTEISSAVTTNQIIGNTPYNFNTDVTLTGYGEESIPSNSLFVRPDYSTHIATASETVSKLATKAFAEQFSRTDQVRVLLNKINTDLLSTNELISILIGFSRVFTETESIADVLAIQLQKAVTDSYITTDVLTSNYNSTKLDVFAITDVFATLVDFKRQFADHVVVTDDVFGLANIDDDQIASFGKVLVDSILLDDTLSLTASFIRSFSETTISNEEAKLLVNKASTELVNSSDLSTILINFNRLFTETKTPTDVLAVSLQKTVTDSYTTTDTLANNYSSAKLDLVAASDTSILDFSRQITDQIIATEDIQTVVNFSKAIADITSLIQDVIILNFTASRALVDTVTNSETKTANIQNFFGSDFVQAGYVGTNLTL